MSAPGSPDARHSDPRQPRLALCAAGARLHRRGLVAGRAGNLSLRLDERRLLVTPAGSRLVDLEPDDLLEVEAATGSHPPRATTELASHRACYVEGVGAVVHTHAPGLTALGLMDAEMGAFLPEIDLALGAVVPVPFAPSGSAELARHVGRAVRDGGTVLLLRGHGALSVGATLDEALDRTELGELSARAILMSRR